MRCFIAIELSDKVTSLLCEIEERLKKSKANIKWVKPENIHLTLKFLGNIKEENADEISQKMKKACKKYKPFTIEVTGIGIFPNLRAPRVIWAGILENNTLQQIQESIDLEMMSLGFEREKRKFKPHLTLGRFRSGTGKEGILEEIKTHEKNSFGTVHAQSISLMKSELHPEGARHTKISEVTLNTANSI